MLMSIAKEIVHPYSFFILFTYEIRMNFQMQFLFRIVKAYFLNLI